MADFDSDGLMARLVNRLRSTHSMRGAMLSDHRRQEHLMFGSTITEGEGKKVLVGYSRS